MDQEEGAISDNIEVVPVVVVSQTFPARPSAIPDIRDFVRGCLAESPLSPEDTREVGETVSAALLEAAGPTGAISVSFRIFPDHVEVDVLRSGPQGEKVPGVESLTSMLRNRPAEVESSAAAATAVAAGGSAGPAAAGSSGEPGTGPVAASSAGSEPAAEDAESGSFADWMSGVLRREGMSVESAAKQLGVSVKTVSRWVGGSTEPRLRDLRRIHDVFGEVPFP